MKKHYNYFILLLFFLSGFSLTAQTIWDGPTITFEKEMFANPELPENQDSLTPNVILTRADVKGIFNIAQEEEYQGDGNTNFGPSPVGTEWAFGRIADGIDTTAFTTWVEATAIAGGGAALPPQLLDEDMILHLIEEDIYIDFKFTVWGQGANGGAMSYERSTPSPTNVEDIKVQELIIYPNPAQSFLQIKNMEQNMDIQIFDASGMKVMDQKIAVDERILIESLPNGIYLVKTNNGLSTTFTKM